MYRVKGKVIRIIDSCKWHDDLNTIGLYVCQIIGYSMPINYCNYYR